MPPTVDPKSALAAALDATPIDDGVDAVFAWLESKFPMVAPLLKITNEIIDIYLKTKGI